jgi:ribose/xylose/arabinose/galactoside ABC-type transport system permease subunit
MKSHRLFWPAAMLVALLALNLAFHPDFLAIKMVDGHLYGNLVSILIYGAPTALIALGMTLVIATGGIDLSVGAVIAIAGAIACSSISRLGDQNSVSGVLVAVLLSLAAGIALGVWNGALVSWLGIQPIVATLILMVAGRGVAQLITDGQIITLSSTTYSVLGAGYWMTIPVSIPIVILVILGTSVLVRRTALGLLIESVGGNAKASRLVGINARGLTIMVYAFCGLTAAIAGVLLSSNISAADGNNAGLWSELDAILAVVIGGTALTGGRFSIGGTVLGALIIQTLSTTIISIGVPTQTTLVFKAIVVIIVSLLQSPVFRAKVIRRRRTPSAPVETVVAAPEMEVSS